MDGSETPSRDAGIDLRAVLNHLAEAVLVTDLEDVIVYASARLEEVLGYAPDEVVGRLAYQLFPSSGDKKLVGERIERRKRGVSERYELPMKHKNGTTVWIEVYGTPLLGGDGAVVGTLGGLTDITERKRAEQKLVAAELHYRRLVETSPYGIFSLDGRGRFTEANPAAERVFGRRQHELLGSFAPDFLDRKDAETALRLFQLLRSGELNTVEVEMKVIPPSGEPRLVQACATVERERGEVSGVYGLVRDITTEKSREERVLLLAAALESLEEAVLITDPEGRSVYSNAAHSELLGHPPGRPPEEGVAAFLPDQSARLELDEIQRVTSETGGWSGRVRRLRSDGRVITVKLIMGRVSDAQGRELFLSIGRDAGEEIERERQLKRTERLASLGTLLGGVAHELNNPLTAIKSFAQLMQQEKKHDPEDREALEVIQREAGRAAKIVSDLRLVARSTQQEGGERIPLDLGEVVEHTLRVRAYSLDTHNIEVKAELMDKLPMIEGDRAEMEQVLLNLVVNAEQAMTDARRPRRLTVSTQVEGGEVALSVKDSGTGIPADHLDRIFDPFWTTKPPGEGTGLGLSLVHGIVVEHGGRIRVDSRPGRGTTFTVRFPQAKFKATPNDREKAAAPKPPASVLNVLVVDDEGAIRSALRRYLVRRGHQVAEAADGTEALQKISEQTPDVIVADLRMPGLGGEELLEALSRKGGGLERRLILITGDAASPDAARLLSSPNVPIVIKPFDLAEVAALIESRAREVEEKPAE
ncbi:MAG: PAS domain-containing hybrid sensor histidine kinase/response regulator [Longimicrobiaceae bacterium]